MQITESWVDIRAGLRRIRENEAHIFTDEELDLLEVIVDREDKEVAADLVAFELLHAGLRGDLLKIYAERIGVLLGRKPPVVPVPLLSSEFVREF